MDEYNDSSVDMTSDSSESSDFADDSFDVGEDFSADESDFGFEESDELEDFSLEEDSDFSMDDSSEDLFEDESSDVDLMEDEETFEYDDSEEGSYEEMEEESDEMTEDLEEYDVDDEWMEDDLETPTDETLEEDVEDFSLEEDLTDESGGMGSDTLDEDLEEFSLDDDISPELEDSEAEEVYEDVEEDSVEDSLDDDGGDSESADIEEEFMEDSIDENNEIEELDDSEVEDIAEEMEDESGEESADLTDDELSDDLEEGFENEDDLEEESPEMEPEMLEEPTDSDDDVEEGFPADESDSSDDTEINSVSDYMNAHNYSRDDFEEYSQDPQWRTLMREEFPDYELPPMDQEKAKDQLRDYMFDHNYGMEDYDEYSQDPIWRELHSSVYPESEIPPLNDIADESLENEELDSVQNDVTFNDDEALDEAPDTIEDMEIESLDSFEEQSDGDLMEDDSEWEDFSDRLDGFFQEDEETDLNKGVDDSQNDVIPDSEWIPPAIDGMDIVDPAADIAPLEVTNQGFDVVEMDDGTLVRVFDHPNDLQESLPYSQGNNDYYKTGTCALAGTGVRLQTAGSKYGENVVVGYSSTHNNERGRPLCDDTGGTYPEDIPTIWGHFGMPAYNDYSKNLESIAEAVENGQAVQVGVNAGKLWERDNAEGFVLNDPNNDCYEDGGANHAINIMSCERNIASGNITHFYINDTGRSVPRDACRKISAEDFWHAFHVDRAVATISKKPVW